MVVATSCFVGTKMRYLPFDRRYERLRPFVCLLHIDSHILKRSIVLISRRYIMSKVYTG